MERREEKRKVASAGNSRFVRIWRVNKSGVSRIFCIFSWPRRLLPKKVVGEAKEVTEAVCPGRKKSNWIFRPERLVQAFLRLAPWENVVTADGVGMIWAIEPWLVESSLTERAGFRAFPQMVVDDLVPLYISSAERQIAESAHGLSSRNRGNAWPMRHCRGGIPNFLSLAPSEISLASSSLPYAPVWLWRFVWGKAMFRSCVSKPVVGTAMMSSRENANLNEALAKWSNVGEEQGKERLCKMGRTGNCLVTLLVKGSRSHF